MNRRGFLTALVAAPIAAKLPQPVAAAAPVAAVAKPAILDVPFIEKPHGHRVVIRTGLPQATWVRFYEGRRDHS